MKKILLAILAVVMMSGASFAGGSAIVASHVGASNTTQTTSVITGGQTIGVNSRGTLVYNITANATSANGECDLYDTAASGSTSISTGEVAVYEVKVATSGDSRSVDMGGAPLRTFYGLTVVSTNANCYVNAQY